jgi:uncharacterized membrane protein HdeD (DUF308 family)
MEKKEMSLTERLVAPTSGFFKKVRTIGLCLAAIGGAIIAAPIALPAIVVTVAGYLTVAGGVMTAVSQVTVEGE